MASSITPQVYGPDGVLRNSLLFTTTIASRFFTGTIDASTVDMEVSIRGGAFAPDPDLITFDGTSWVMPNPEAYPDGLELEAGLNEIRIRAITTSGSVSSAAIISVRLIQSGDLGTITVAPTNVTLEQLDGRVEITVDAPSDTTNFRGMNYWASLYEGGGVTGYTRLNIQVVDDSTTIEETEDVGSLEIESDVVTNLDGSHAADPLYVQYVGTQVNADGTVLQADFTEQLEVPETASRLRSTLSLQSVRVVNRYSFSHSRSATTTSTPPTVYVGAFAAAPVSDPLFYVVTAVYYDPNTMLETESAVSIEVVGHPLIVTTTVGTFPVVTRQQIVRNTIESIFRSNPQLKVEPGSVLRDTFIDPFSSEAERLRFIVDFLHRAQSFAGLLAVDDPQNTGTSASVGTTPYKVALKKAFGLTSDADTQAVIDRAFESLAGNYGVFRRPGQFARGEVTFFTTKRPTRTIPIPLGTTVSGGSVVFRTTETSSIPFENLASYYDPTTGRYRVTVSVQATSVGASGNVATGQVRAVVSGVTGLSVINSGSMFGGADQETNLQLATRAQNALASVDSGTARGYLQTAADVPGVLQANVVSAGDPLMMRDLDAAGVHRGGKVDIWVQGENLATVTDTFSFALDEAKDIHFVVVGDPADLIFRAIDPNLSAGLPIVEMLDAPAQGLGLRNATTGLYFDLTNVQITNYDTIQLDTSLVQPAVTLSDVVLGDYRRRTGNTFVMLRQPVRAVTSVVGTVSGTLPTTAYTLYFPKDPLEEGRSNLAADYLEIVPVSDGSGGLIPSGGSLTVTDESHVLVGEYLEYLDNLGADPLTVVVTNSDGTITYRGPDDPSGISDYLIVYGDETNALAIQRVPTGDIASGDTVLIDYEHDENFTVTYTTNVIVDVVQDAVNNKRHVTADVLVKEAVEVPVDIAATIILVRGAEQSTVDSAVRTNLTNLFGNFRLGDPVRQSDLVAVIEGTTGVSYVEVPLTTMVRGEGSTVVREAVASDAEYIAGWSSATVSVWLLTDALASATTNGGGSTNRFRGVFQSDALLALLLASPSSSLKTGAGQAFIIGSGGYVIPGISDDTTLIAEGYTTQAEIEAQRVLLTANRILVSTSVDDSPANYDYSITYIVGQDSGPKNITTSAAEYLVVGNVEFTYDEDR